LATAGYEVMGSSPSGASGASPGCQRALSPSGAGPPSGLTTFIT
jgi:hypothetical protein